MSEFLHRLPIPLSIKLLRRFSGANPLIVNYHMVSDTNLPYIENLYKYRDTQTFKEDLKLYRRHFHPISMKEFLDTILESKNSLPRNAMLLTFDDGFREMYDVVAPILVEQNFPATFFISRDFLDNKLLNHDNRQSLLINAIERGPGAAKLKEIEALLDIHHIQGKDLKERLLKIPYRKQGLVDSLAMILGLDYQAFLQDVKPYMSTSQVSELVNQGFHIGGHSIDHARFPELDLDEQLDQARSSVNHLLDTFGIGYRIFAFPYSDRGVGSKFFTAVKSEFDASFGTHGLLEDPADTHFQRISVEKYAQAARKTIKFHYARRIIYNSMKKQIIKR